MKKLLLSLILITSTAVTAPTFSLINSNIQTDEKLPPNSFEPKTRTLIKESDEGTEWNHKDMADIMDKSGRYKDVLTSDVGGTAILDVRSKFSTGIGYDEGTIYQLLRATLSSEFPSSVELNISSNFDNDEKVYVMQEGKSITIHFETIEGMEGIVNYEGTWGIKIVGLKDSAIKTIEETSELIDGALTTYNLHADSPFSDIELFSVNQIKKNLETKSKILPPNIQLTIIDSYRKNALYPDEILNKFPKEKYNSFELRIRDTESGTEIFKKIVLNNIGKLKLSFETETDIKNNLTILKISNYDFIKNAGMTSDFGDPLFKPVSSSGSRNTMTAQKTNVRSSCVASDIKTNCWDTEEGIFYINNDSVSADKVEITFPSSNGFFDDSSNGSKVIVDIESVVVESNLNTMLIVFGAAGVIVLVLFSVVITVSTIRNKRKRKIKRYISDEDVARFKQNGFSKRFIKSIKQVAIFNDIEKNGLETGMDLVHMKKKTHKAEQIWLDSHNLNERQLKLKKMSPKKLMGIEAFLSEQGSKKIKKKINKWQKKQ